MPRIPIQGEEVLIYSSDLRYINFFYIFSSGAMLHFGQYREHKKATLRNFLYRPRYYKNTVPPDKLQTIEERWNTIDGRWKYLETYIEDYKPLYAYFRINQKIWTSEFYEKLKNQN